MQDPLHNPERVESGKYQADVQRGGTEETFWCYVSRRKDSNEIIDLAKIETREEAMEAAQRVLAGMKPARGDELATFAFNRLSKSQFVPN
jgi:hypothetical protein